MGKFQKFCSERIHRVTDRRVVFEFPEIWPMEISEIMHCLPDNQKKTQNFALLSRSCYCADCAQNPTGPAPGTVLKSAPDFIQIGSLSAELYPNV